MEYQFIRTQLEFTRSTHSWAPTQIYWIRSRRLRPSNLCFCRPSRWFSGTLTFENTILGWIAFPNSDSPPLRVSKEKKRMSLFIACSAFTQPSIISNLHSHSISHVQCEQGLQGRKGAWTNASIPCHIPRGLCVPAPCDEDPCDQTRHQNSSRWLGAEINSTNFLYMTTFKFIKV